MKLPKELLVTVEKAGTDDEFLSAHTKQDGAGEIGVIKDGGIYILKERVKVSVKTDVQVQ